mmetsp:Transcript_42314/g.105609  ORF Transcript_42314/g.105609 Transcript_42314/m.105609 type:complete len:154 (+) Transcript_42314:616-1077(+)
MGKHFKKAYMTMFQERLQAVTRKGAPGHDLVNILNNDVREDRFRLRNGTISIETVVTEYGDLPKVMKRELRLSRKESKALIRGGLSAMGDYDYFIANQPQDTTDVVGVDEENTNTPKTLKKKLGNEMYQTSDRCGCVDGFRPHARCQAPTTAA